ncbi:hypothetical protein OsccyDRAFT_2004 [Leptolyngbyaceae cyanobacterium JSC-12]|nr:hypothetical protein OsccyDRAFT_2004 [Leptolyngbyaceae cyanobacterium JSC-12]
MLSIKILLVRHDNNWSQLRDGGWVPSQDIEVLHYATRQGLLTNMGWLIRSGDPQAPLKMEIRTFVSLQL